MMKIRFTKLIALFGLSTCSFVALGSEVEWVFVKDAPPLYELLSDESRVGVLLNTDLKQLPIIKAVPNSEGVIKYYQQEKLEFEGLAQLYSGIMDYISTAVLATGVSHAKVLPHENIDASTSNRGLKLAFSNAKDIFNSHPNFIEVVNNYQGTDINKLLVFTNSFFTTEGVDSSIIRVFNGFAWVADNGKRIVRSSSLEGGITVSLLDLEAKRQYMLYENQMSIGLLRPLGWKKALEKRIRSYKDRLEALEEEHEFSPPSELTLIRRVTSERIAVDKCLVADTEEFLDSDYSREIGVEYEANLKAMMLGFFQTHFKPYSWQKNKLPVYYKPFEIDDEFSKFHLEECEGLD